MRRNKNAAVGRRLLRWLSIVSLCALCAFVTVDHWPAAAPSEFYSNRQHGDAEIQPIEPVTSGSVKVNIASQEELTELYGVGPAYATAIVLEREANGPFFYPEDLLVIKGIGQKRLAGFRDQLDLSQEE